MRPHYHVLSGDHGYMPDYNLAYSSKAEAQQGLLEWKRDCEQSVDEDMGKVFDGSIRANGYECRYPQLVGLEYISLVPCYETDCLDEDDSIA